MRIKVDENGNWRSFRHRNFRILYPANAMSNIGTWAQRVAQDWLVLELTDNNGFYQWKKNGNIIANSNNSSLTINPIGIGDAGSYSVLISNSCGIDSSMVVTLTVNARPTALISGTANICNGQSVALNIAVSGNGTISGILSDGSSFSGNAPNISVTKFPTSNTTYTVSSVSDNHCAAMPADLSGSAAVTVNARPMAAISGSTTICNGQNVSLYRSGILSIAWRWRPRRRRFRRPA